MTTAPVAPPLIAVEALTELPVLAAILATLAAVVTTVVPAFPAILAPEAERTLTMPGLIVVIVGAWFAMTVISPSDAGMTTSVTLSDRSRRSGDTSSKLNSSAMNRHSSIVFAARQTARDISHAPANA